MKHKNMILILCAALCLTGCAQPVEKDVVTVKDTAVENPQPSTQTDHTASAVENADNADSTPNTVSGALKDALKDITKLDDAPVEIELSADNIADKNSATQWKRWMCEWGGIGFYYPQYSDGDTRNWKMPDVSDPSFNPTPLSLGIMVYTNNQGLQLDISIIDDMSMEDARRMAQARQEQMLESGALTMDTTKEDSDSFQVDCTVGAHDYPAIRTQRLKTPAVEETEETVGQEENYTQYYYVQGPEGLTRIWISSPAAETEESWKDMDAIMDSLIIESKEDYPQMNCAIPRYALDWPLQFTSPEALADFYCSCIMRGDYSSAMAVSRNVESSNDGADAWKNMKCFISAYNTAYTNENRATEDILLSFTKASDIELPSAENGDISIVRHLYLVREGNYWYVDGPLHNEDAPLDWWDGTAVSWSVENYGFSDSTDPGTVLHSQEEYNSWLDNRSAQLDENSR